MSAFEDIGLSWDGRDYTIRANQVMGAIARIEDHITFGELTGYAERKTAPIGKLSQAYAAVLRHAGAPVTDEDVYEGMFATGGDPQGIMDSIMTLLLMFIPKSAMPSEAEEEKPSRKKRRAAAASSKRRTKQRSAKPGS